MNTLAQKFLKTKTLQDLELAHAVNYRIDGHKVSLNYDMLAAKENDPLANQCRGLVLARSDFMPIAENLPLSETIVLCRPMDRFFNHGQIYAHELDFTSNGIKFYEKLDGTMCALYYDWHLRQWCVATRSVASANLPMDGFGTTFRMLFERAVLDTTGHKFADWTSSVANLSMDNTYIFELCTPQNQIVVKHENYDLYLLAVRNNKSGVEYHIEDFGNDFFGVPLCHTYDLNSLSDMIEFVSGRDPSQYEGVVARDESFRRVKVKSPGYLALSRIKEAAVSTPRALVELCLLGKLDDAEGLLPNDIRDRAFNIKDGLGELVRTSDGLYVAAIAEVEDKFGWADEKKQRKELALICRRDHLEMSYVMSRYSGKCNSYQDWIDQHIDPETGKHSKTFLEHLLKTVENKKK